MNKKMFYTLSIGAFVIMLLPLSFIFLSHGIVMFLKKFIMMSTIMLECRGGLQQLRL